MSKVTLENKKGKITIANRLSYPETINERVYNAISSGMFEGFIPVYVTQKRKETRLECDVRDWIPFSQYFSGIVNQKLFLDFVHKVTLLIKNCEDNKIDAINLDLQSELIFVDPKTGGIKCIFWPVVNNQRSCPPHMFLKQLPLQLNFNPNENNNYLEIYKSFFYGNTPFSVNSFEKMILQLSGKTISSSYTTPFESSSDSLDEKISFSKSSYINNKADIEYDPFSNNSEQNTPNENLHEVNNFFLPPLNSPCPLNESNFFKSACPTLTRLRTGETFSVDKPLFRIGSSQSCCDFFVSDNNYISRNHANIVTRNGRYYIVDQNSTNKTFVNGKIILASTETEIFNETQICLANEHFIFKV